MAAFNLGDIFATFKARTEGFRQAAKEIQGTRKETEDLGKSGDGAGKKIVGAVSSVIAIFGGARLAVEAFRDAANFEQTRIGLENMLGSADKAREVLAEIADYAEETPFGFPELADATRQLVAFGFKGREAIDTMKMLGDVGAAVGAPMNDLAYLMGTLRTQGRAMTVDIRQFAQRGIPIYEYLARVLKVNVNEVSDLIEKGKVGFPEVQKAFQLMTSEGEIFHGTMEKQSKSVSGLVSTIQDKLMAALRDLIGIDKQGDILEGSLLWKIKEGATALIEEMPRLVQEFKDFIGWVVALGDQIGQYLAPKLAELWQVVQDKLIPALNRFWNEIGKPVAEFLGVALVASIGLVIDSLNMLVPALTWLIDVLSENRELVISIIGFLGTLWLTLKAKEAIESFVANFTAGFNAALSLVNDLRGKRRGVAGLQDDLAGLGTSLIGFNGWTTFAAVGISALASFGVAIAQTLAAISEFKKLATQKVDAARANVDATLQKFKAGSASKEDLAKALRESYITQNEWGNFTLDRFAKGGPVEGGKPIIVGEEGQELFVPKSDGMIIDAKKTRRILDGLRSMVSGVSPLAMAVPNMNVNLRHITINLDGANITSPDIAQEYAERIGDSIIKRLQVNQKV